MRWAVRSMVSQGKVRKNNYFLFVPFQPNLLNKLLTWHSIHDWNVLNGQYNLAAFIIKTEFFKLNSAMLTLLG